jgi:two-component system chemotaxis sensor kinase CheA
MDDLNELLPIFKEESLDLIERVRNKCQNFLTSSDKIERFQDILRVIHTIKGNAASVGFSDLRTMAHDLESSVLVFKTKEDQITQDVLDGIYKFFDSLESFLEEGTPPSPPTPSSTEPAFCIFDDPEPPTVSAPLPISKKETEKKEGEGKKSSGDFIRIPTEKIQKNIDILSEIFLLRNQMRYLVDKHYSTQLGQEDFLQNWELLDNSLRKSIGELEQIAMSMRMTPVANLLHRMQKTVRSYLDEHKDKNIRVEIEGEDVEIDKKIIDSLSEPLVHLTRNAMDHGIEPTSERKKLGKTDMAVIQFHVSISNNEAIIRVKDDGRGIDAEKVYASAVKKGLKVDHIQTKEEMINLIFLPGFSTVEKVSDTSGRGIGMEAVKTYVESLNGSIEIKTKINEGTEFILKLPIGMSVIPVLIAKANRQQFAILNSDVLELKKITAHDVIKNGEKYFYKRGQEFIRCFPLNNYLYQDYKKDFGVINNEEKIPLCIVNVNGELTAIRVEELVANAEIIVKEYPTISPKLSYISGVSILATGEPTFVVSLSKLCEKIYKSENERAS